MVENVSRKITLIVVLLAASMALLAFVLYAIGATTGLVLGS